MYLTINMMRKLLLNGFSFKEFEHCCNIGMTFFYDNAEYTIGGHCNDSHQYSRLDRIVASEGIWLPNEGDLMRWLQLTDHSVEITYSDTDNYFHSKAINQKGDVFEGGGADLLMALYKLVFKICKKSGGKIVPRDILILDIENE